MAAILKKMAAILDFQVAHRADLTSSPQRTFVPNLVLVSQFARLVPLSAPLDAALNNSLRLVSECIRSPPTFMLPVVSGLLTSAETNNAVPYAAVLKQTASTRYITSWQQSHQDESDCNPATLSQSKPSKYQRRSWKVQQGEGAEGTWETRLGITCCRLRESIHTPSNKPIWHDLGRHSLVRPKRTRTGYGRFKSIMNHMGLSPSASCECGAANQTAHHIGGECPLHKIIVTGTWWCWTLQHATDSTTCSVSYRTPQSNARRRRTAPCPEHQQHEYVRVIT